MDQDHLLKITLALYRVTDCFPEKEPLRYAIREAAGRIYTAGISSCARSSFRADVRLLRSYFAIAKAQNWVAQENFAILEKAYEDLGKENHADKKNKNRAMESSSRLLKKHRRGSGVFYSPSERKHRIADMIQQEQKITLKDLINKFPEIHKRTLIRDLEKLQKEDIIKKQGNGRGTFYFPNGGAIARGQMVTEGEIAA